MKAGQFIIGGIKRTVVTILFLGFLSLFLGGSIALGASYKVEQGDTIWLLAQKYNITAQEIAAANNLNSPWIIYPEQILAIPVEIHTIQKGDTLWQLSVRYNVDLQALFEANPGIDPLNLLPDQNIFLPKESKDNTLLSTSGDQLASREGRTSTMAGFSAQEIDLLARLVHSESAGEPYMGQVAVAATVLNRIKSSLYPNTLSSVIYQIVSGCYQYSPVLDGRINIPAGKTAFDAVYDALKGWDPSGNALGFYNPQKTSNQWVRQQQVTATIGNHIFFR
jgi:N-acetylmuramoyl-L-alanine amidase